MRDKNKIPTENDMTLNMLEAFLEPCYILYSFNKNIK